MLVIGYNTRYGNQIIDEVLSRDDLYESKKEGFIRQFAIFREEYNV